MNHKVLVTVVGMIPFAKPSNCEPYPFGPHIALQHNLGLDGACAVTLYRNR